MAKVYWAAGFLLLLGVAFVSYFEFYQRRLIAGFIVSLIFLAIALLSYGKWGNFYQFKNNQAQLGTHQHLVSTLREMGTPEEIMQRMYQHLSTSNDSGDGWFLLGRLLYQQKKYAEAAKTLQVAVTKQPENEKILINYCQARLMAVGEEAYPEISARLQGFLINHPESNSALSFLNHLRAASNTDLANSR